MEAFIIEQAGQIKEAFTYDRPLIEATLHALEEYARATIVLLNILLLPNLVRRIRAALEKRALRCN